MASKKKILILSPHADDAAFSCCDHIIQWRKQSIDITVCTLFSKFKTPKVSKDAKGYLKNSGFLKVGAFEKARYQEDKNALNYLGVNFVNLHLTDGAFRTIKNNLIYKSFDKLFSGKVSNLDKITIKKLKKYLNLIEKRYDFIICPLGMGNHADHLITSISAQKFISPNKLGFYLDVPYFFRINNWSSPFLKMLLKYKKSYKWTSKDKLRTLNFYPSQLPLILRNNSTFFFNKKMIYFPEIILLPNDNLSES